MILEIDMGNTWTKWRVLDGARVLDRGRTPSAAFPQKDILSLGNISRVRLATVTSVSTTTTAIAMLSSALGITVELAQTTAFQAGVRNSYHDPLHMGVDRWLAMLAGYNTAKHACLVVSCGTAVTVDVLAQDGVHQGGYILPGLVMMREVLLSNTSRIHYLPGDYDVQRAPGTSTAAAVEHGAVHAVLSSIESLCMDSLKQRGSCHLYITGGDAPALIKQMQLGAPQMYVYYVEDLVLDGLRHALP